MNELITIAIDSIECRADAIDLANTLSLPFAELSPQQLQLVITQRHIEMRAPDLGKPIFIDFEQGKNAHRRQFGGGRGQALAKAIGLKKGATPTVIDATAGFGRDAFVLANLGCTITLIERNPLIAALLHDAVNRAINNDELHDIISRMSVINHNAIDYLNTLTSEKPDVVYLDPMYPSREKSALVKKDMRLLHQLAGEDNDSHQLLSSARLVARKRVVIKRPKSAPFVGDQKPDTHIESKNTRYDVYLVKTSE